MKEISHYYIENYLMFKKKSSSGFFIMTRFSHLTFTIFGIWRVNTDMRSKIFNL